MDLSGWTPRPRPERVALEGRYARLEPLVPDVHGAALRAASQAQPERFRWLFEEPPEVDPAAYEAWLARAAAGSDPMFWAVVCRETGRVEGRQALMRIDPANGVIEIGNILWGPAIAGTRVATEALFLHARHVLDDLGYRRFEWKCHDLNEPSKRAALRFGFAFEGVFRQHMVHKGANRDTAWFAMTDADWPALRRRFEAWLDPENFDPEGRQRRHLQAC
jgi:RimJ/RimL family protein N-acetyltransferase